MRVSKRGLDLIKQFEGFREDAYQDVVGVWTIGYGFTMDVRPGDHITRKQADARLAAEMGPYESAVLKATGGNCTQPQFDALCSFAFNVGIAGMAKSTVIKCHVRGDYDAAARAFGLWNKAGGKVWPGLTRRRAAEAAMYLESDEELPMPQAVEPESKLTGSPIVTATTITAITAPAAQVAGDFKTIREGLGEWLPWVLVVAGMSAAGVVLYQRWRQRRGGWA